MSPRQHRLLGGAAIVGLALLGAFLGASLAPAATAHVGPITVGVHVRPSLHPGAQLQLAPFGSVSFDTHRAPVAIQADIDSVDVDQAREVVASTTDLSDLEQRAPGEMKGAVERAAAWTVIFSVLGALLFGLIGGRSLRAGAETSAIALAVVVGIAVGSWATFDQDALAQPRFSGALSRAPYVVGQTQGLVQRLESYRAGVSDLVDSVTALYAVGDRLPTAPSAVAHDEVITVLHISDIHDNPLGFDLTTRLAQQFDVDAVVDTGDVTTNGTPLEAAQLDRIGQLKVPYVFIKGNHDSASTVSAVAAQKNAVVLDDSVKTVAGLTFAGIGDPRFTPVEGPAAPDRDLAQASDAQLASTITAYDEAHIAAPVEIALVHDPLAAGPLTNTVPLILAGHLHKREVLQEGATKVLVEGSTGGALITSDGLIKAASGEAVPLEATLLYFGRSGTDQGRLLAYDEVTVGGLGLTSVSVQRTVLRPGQIARPGELPTITPGPSTPSISPGGSTPLGASGGGSGPTTSAYPTPSPAG